VDHYRRSGRLAQIAALRGAPLTGSADAQRPPLAVGWTH